jgi:hypothetical protein
MKETYIYDVTFNNGRIIKIKTDKKMEEILRVLLEERFKPPMFLKAGDNFINIEQISYMRYKGIEKI